MPTGYTLKIADGISFKEYALDCARNFCHDCSKLPEKFEEETYYRDKLEESERELEKAKKLTIKQAEKLAKENYNSELASIKKGIKEKRDLENKYRAMLEKVRLYVPPTEQHRNYANFLISQIEESIEFDCSGDYYEKELARIKLMSGKEYKENLIKKTREDITYNLKYFEEEKARNKQKNDWLKDLRDSIEVTEQLIKEKGLE